MGMCLSAFILGVKIGSSAQGVPMVDTGTTSFKAGVVYFNRQNVSVGLKKYAFVRMESGSGETLKVYETSEYLPDHFVKLEGKIWSVERDASGDRIIRDTKNKSTIRYY